MAQPGGYDYYRTLTEAIRAKIRGKTEDEIQHILNSSSRPTEVIYNKAAYNKFVAKFGSKRTLEEFEKRGQVSLADGDVAIRVAPIFSITSSGTLNAFHVWASQNPKLDKRKANAGNYLISQAFRRTAPNYKYSIFDAVEGKSYSGFGNNTGIAVDAVARNIANYAKM